MLISPVGVEVGIITTSEPLIAVSISSTISIFLKSFQVNPEKNTLTYPTEGFEPDNLLQISIDAGYYDQSHMIKDFSQLASNTPTTYLKLLKDADYKKRLIVV